ncbi:flagellar basal body-associated FliL family protein [Pacificimonas sp. WHA3]|uniref:Flagellar protein FliL n=1 Tax=Pacificimonas pallii TaxID=2827236 RepID=A0ABS6SGM0_9SPHN|nr:flagellar basal body-associated FliL family protein [Pacificimonas pallii]MBV7256997.1 flagellar basal body-associated FliL family protein [Pacificimonas pallii]
MAKKEKVEDTDGEDAGKKKGGGMKKMLMILVLVGGIAGGGGFYAFSSGMLGNQAEAAAAKDLPPELTYHAFERAFTFNERQGSRLIQLSLSISAHGPEPIADRIAPHESAMRSALLQTLMDVTREDLNDVKSRTALLERLKKVMNTELDARTGEGGIEEVFFTDVIIQ